MVMAGPIQPPLSTLFSDDDVDLLIRAAGTLDFLVHKPIMAFSSPVFANMLRFPQPPSGAPGALRVIDVNESPETWENILRTIYHLPNSIFDNHNGLESLLLTTKKYLMQHIIDSQIKKFESREFLQQDPLHLYTIACACGFEDLAKRVARNTELSSIMERPNLANLNRLTPYSYHNLVTFVSKRDKEWRLILDSALVPSEYLPCRCRTRSIGDLYEGIKRDLSKPYLQTEEIYDEAAEHRDHRPCTSKRCAASGSEVRAFIEQVMKEREGLYDKLMCGRQYVQRHLPVSSPLINTASSRFIVQ